MRRHWRSLIAPFTLTRTLPNRSGRRQHATERAWTIMRSDDGESLVTRLSLLDTAKEGSNGGATLRRDRARIIDRARGAARLGAAARILPNAGGSSPSTTIAPARTSSISRSTTRASIVPATGAAPPSSASGATHTASMSAGTRRRRSTRGWTARCSGQVAMAVCSGTGSIVSANSGATRRMSSRRDRPRGIVRAVIGVPGEKYAHDRRAGPGRPRLQSG